MLPNVKSNGVVSFEKNTHSGGFAQKDPSGSKMKFWKVETCVCLCFFFHEVTVT